MNADSRLRSSRARTSMVPETDLGVVRDLRLHRVDRFAAQFLPYLASHFAHHPRRPPLGALHEIPGRLQSVFVEQFDRVFAEPPHVLERDTRQEMVDVTARDRRKAFGLAVVGGDFGERLGRREAERYGDAQFAPDLFLEHGGDLGVGGAEDPSHAGQVREPLVDRILLHRGRVAVHDREHPLREQAVGLVVAGQDHQLGTAPPRLVQRHAAPDPQGLRLVTRAGDDPALPAAHHRPPAQLRVQRLFHGSEKRVAVHVQDRARK